MGPMGSTVFLLLCGMASVEAAGENPIRKVVRLMQDMQHEIEAEKEKEQGLFEKFMCICDSYPAELQTAIETSGKTIVELGSKIQEETAARAQIVEDLKRHTADKASAEQDLAKAGGLREKESAEYDSSVADLKGSIGQLDGAIPSLEKGGSFVQTAGAGHLKKIIQASSLVSDFDKKQVLAFLATDTDAPQSSEVLGILKAMRDDMQKNLAEAESGEKASASGFADLKGAKDQEVAAAAEAIQAKEKRDGELAVSLAQSADSLDDAQSEDAASRKMLNTLTTTCDSKKVEWQARLKLRTDEVTAISEAVNILNDDDALDVFKKTALVQQSARPEAKFLQTNHAVTSTMKLKQAVAIVRQASQEHHDVHLELLLNKMTTRLRSKQGPDFGAVSKLIDEMVAVMTREQAEDAKKKDWCVAEIAKGETAQQTTQGKVDGLGSSIAQVSDEVAGVVEDIAALQREISDLDKSVAEATEQRKKAHEEYSESLQMSEAAVALLEKAKNRLHKFYNPAVYRAPPKTERSMEEKIIASYGFIQRHSVERDLPVMPELPKYEQKNSGGAIALMDALQKDLEKDKLGAQHDEKTAQSDYVELMADSHSAREQDSKGTVTKQVAKAELEKRLQQLKEDKHATDDELMNAHTFLGDLHASCDFVVENFQMRADARAAELESLKSAKAVLAGASSL